MDIYHSPLEKVLPVSKSKFFSKKKSNKISKRCWFIDDTHSILNISNLHLRGINFPYLFYIPEIRIFASLNDKDNRKVTIKRNAGKWRESRNGQNSFPPRKVDSRLTDPNEDTTNIETLPQKPQTQTLYLSRTDRLVCPPPPPPATMRLDWPEASGKKREALESCGSLVARAAAAPARKRRLSGILLMWDKQTSMAARSRQHIGPGLINRDGAFLSGRPRTD